MAEREMLRCDECGALWQDVLGPGSTCHSCSKGKLRPIPPDEPDKPIVVGEPDDEPTAR